MLEALLRDAAPTPGGSLITLEPGGQLELSSPVAHDLSQCWCDLERDVAWLDRALAEHDLTASRVALDPLRTPQRLLHTPRYDAMQKYFDRVGSAGTVMMTGTASIQINLDAGTDGVDVARRWALLHAVGPALVAAFANSPMHLGRVTGWKSTRQQVLLAMDPTRTSAPIGPDPVEAWAEYALDAPVMMWRRPGGWLASPGFTFRDWVSGMAGIGAPTVDDLAYHLTTLFPPVRPRGWLEVRFLDAQPREWWPVPLAVVTTLLNDPAAADAACEAAESRPLEWGLAARRGLADPELLHVAARCFEAAISALPRLGAGPELISLVTGYLEHFAARGRCPADDFLDDLYLPQPRRTLTTLDRS